jgi:inner membrane protein involved in colicin E2 resistance
MALYNDTFFNNATNPLDLIIGIGRAISQDYLFGNLLLLGFFLIFLLGALKMDFMEVLLIDAFLTTVIAILLAFAGMVSFVTISFPFIIFIVALVFYWFKG